MRRIRMTLARHVLQFCVGVIAAACCSGTTLAQQPLDNIGNAGWYGHGMAAGDGLVAIGTASTGGYVDIYRRESAGWQFDARVVAIDANSFGYRVALGGGWLAVANRNTAAVNGWPNYVDLFRRDNGGTWVFVQRVDSPAALPFDSGYIDHMAVMANSLVISARRYDGEGGTRDYRTFFYDYANGSWGPARQLVPPYKARFFGADLSVDGDQLAVADPVARVSGSDGVVSIYRRIGLDWVHAAALLSPQPAQLSFGGDVALCGKHLAVLAYPLSGQPLPAQNRVFLYEGENVAWAVDGEPLLSPAPSPSPQYDGFGSGLSCSDSALAMRSNLRNTAHALSLTGTRTLHQLTVALPAYDAGETIVVNGGDVLLADHMGPGGPPSNMRGVVFAFNAAVDSIFVHGFD